MARALTATALLLTTSLPAQAHSEDELTAWLDSYEQMRDYDVADSLPSEDWDLVLDSMRDRHPCSVVLDTACPVTVPRKHVDPVHRGMGGNVEQWRGLVEAYFGAEATNTALCLMQHESGGAPDAYNSSSGASGLMQVLSSWAPKFGYAPADLFDPAVNLEISAALYRDGGWKHWSPWKRGECR